MLISCNFCFRQSYASDLVTEFYYLSFWCRHRKENVSEINWLRNSWNFFTFRAHLSESLRLRSTEIHALPWTLILCVPLLSPKSPSKMLTHVSFDAGNFVIFTRRRNGKAFRRKLGLILPRSGLPSVYRLPGEELRCPPCRFRQQRRHLPLIGNGSKMPSNVSLPLT